MSEPTSRCERCGAANEPNARFCANCGAALPETPAGVSIPLPTATRVVRLNPATGAPVATTARGKPAGATAGALLIRALIALAIGVALVFLNRIDPTGTAGIFAVLAWYIAIICVVLAAVRGLVFRRG